MSAKFRSLTACTLSFILFIGISSAFSAQFTADYHYKSPKSEVKAKLFVRDKQYRLENMPGDVPFIMIRKNDATYSLNLVKMQFKEIYGTQERLANPIAAWDHMAANLPFEQAGAEDIQGFFSHENDYKYDEESGIVLERWTADSLGFPIRQIMHAEDGDYEMYLDNIKVMPVDKTLFEIPSEYTDQATTKQEKKAPPKAEGKSSSGTETGIAPWGRSYSAGAKVTVQLDTEMEPEILIENDQEDPSVCRLTSRKGDEESKPRRIYLKTAEGTAEPFLGFKGFQSVTLEVDTGKVFFIVEQKGDAFSRNGYSEDRYLKTSKKYATVGKGFLVDSSLNLLIKLEADSKNTDGAEGYFKLFKGSYTDMLDSISFNLQNGVSKTWEYSAEKGIASWEITLIGGGIRISYRQPEKL